MLFSENVIYIQIEHDCFNFLHVQSNKSTKIYGKFSNGRLAIAHFKVAEKALKEGVYEVYPKSFFRSNPTVVIHQIYNSEGGLCEIEDRILREAALGAGARQVFVWQGTPLTSTQLQSKEYARK